MITMSPPKRLMCPQCGTSGAVGQVPAISVTIPPYHGEYCLTCHAKWISENVPKLIELSEEVEEICEYKK